MTDQHRSDDSAGAHDGQPPGRRRRPRVDADAATTGGDNHAAPPRAFRPDPDEYNAARTILEEHDRRMADFLRACLRWLHHDPDAALRTLTPHWPRPRRTGRPRRTV